MLAISEVLFVVGIRIKESIRHLGVPNQINRKLVVFDRKLEERHTLSLFFFYEYQRK